MMSLSMEKSDSEEDLKQNREKALTTELDGPPDGFEFVLHYLDLLSRFTVTRLNRFWRDAVNDPLVWKDLCFDYHMSKKLTDDKLVQLVEKANGGLRSFFMIDAVQITEETLRKIFRLNPRLESVSVPACSQFSAELLLSLAQAHSRRARLKRLPGIRQIQFWGLHDMSAPVLLQMKDLVQQNIPSTDPLWSGHRYYGNRGGIVLCNSEASDKRPVDVEVCPDCEQIRVLFDCPNHKDTTSCDRSTSEYQEWVMSLNDNDCNHYATCTACLFCIPRCEECGHCVRIDAEKLESQCNRAVCGDLLCNKCSIFSVSCCGCHRTVCSLHQTICFPNGVEELCVRCYNEVYSTIGTDRATLVDLSDE